MKLFAFTRKIRIRTIRIRLFLAFVIIAILAVIGNTTGTFIVGYFDEQDQARNQLDASALSKALQISAWTESLQNELIVILNEEYAAERIEIALSLAGEGKYYDYINGAVRERLRLLATSSQAFDAFTLLDLSGNVVISTDENWVGLNDHDRGYFQQGLHSPYTQLPFQNRDEFVFAARPVQSADMRVLGVLVGRTDTDALSVILRDQTGLGKSSKTFLVNENYTLLTTLEQNITYVDNAKTDAIDAVLRTRTSYSGTYSDHRNVHVIGVGRWLSEVQAALLVEQDFLSALQTVFSTLSINFAITLAVILLATVISSYVSGNIADPLTKLADTASRVANGDLDRKVSVPREDEVGILADAFNSMTHQVRDLVNNLEQRVNERTVALQDANLSLERQALQLETSAQVSREITSILEISQLLQRVVTLIANAFGYDYVHIYLLDPGEKQLRLQASNTNSNNSQIFQIEDKFLNCEAVRGDRVIQVNKESLDEYFLLDNNQQGVKSELVIPLRFNQHVIGALDVQSRKSTVFSDREEIIFQSLADQIAIAIENARLYNRSRELAMLEERTRLAKDLHDSVTQSLYSLNLMVEGWRLSSEMEKTTHVNDYLGRTGQMVQQMLKEMRLMIYEMRPPVLEEGGLLLALRKRLDVVENRAGIKTRMLVDEFGNLPAQLEEGLYLIAQEALNNTLKHSAARSVTIHLYQKDNKFVLEIKDDGQGFNPVIAADGGGYGLTNMKERAEQLGGSLVIISQPGAGTSIRVTVMHV